MVSDYQFDAYKKENIYFFLFIHEYDIILPYV